MGAVRWSLPPLKFTFVHYLHRHASDNADRYRKQAEEARQQAEKKAISPNDNEARGSASPMNGSSSHCQRREGTGGKAASVGGLFHIHQNARSKRVSLNNPAAPPATFLVSLAR